MRSVEQLEQFNDYLVNRIIPPFAWPAGSLMTQYASWMAYGLQARDAGNTAEYERALRWASDNYDETLARTQAAVTSHNATASPSPGAPTSLATNISASEPEQVRRPADQSITAPAGAPSQAITEDGVTGPAMARTEVEVLPESTTAPPASGAPVAASAPHADRELSAGTVTLVNTGSILIDDDRRAKADQQHVKKLAKSMGVIGLQNAPVVTPGRHLVSGVHRVLACILLGLAEIPVSVVDLTRLQQRIAIIDENLVRRRLPALERAELTAERKGLYEQAHPESVQHRRGGEAKAAGGATAIDAVAPAFATETAKLTGRSERSIRQDSQVAGMPQSVRDAIRDTEVAKHVTELKELARLSAAEQSTVADILKDGRATTVAHALDLVRTTGAAPSATGARERGPGASEPTHADSQRAILIAQRSLLRKTLGSLTGALDDLRGDDKMARHIRYMKPVVTAIDAAIVAMQEDARSYPEFWGEPTPGPTSGAAKPKTIGTPAKRKSKPRPSAKSKGTRKRRASEKGKVG